MGESITRFLVKGKKLSFTEFQKLRPQPETPLIPNFAVLKMAIEENSYLNTRSETIIDTDNMEIHIIFKVTKTRPRQKNNKYIEG